MSWWQKLRTAIFRTSPAFNPTTAKDLAAVRTTAAAKAYDNCADRMERWIEWNAARGKPDWTEFQAILTGWRTSAKYLRGEQ